jgi:hypothetical protein
MCTTNYEFGKPVHIKAVTTLHSESRAGPTPVSQLPFTLHLEVHLIIQKHFVPKKGTSILKRGQEVWSIGQEFS